MTTESNTQKHDTAIDDDLKQQYEKMSAEKLKDLLKDAVLTDNAKNICLSVLTRKIGTEAVNEFTKTHLTKKEKGFPVILRGVLAFFPLIIGGWVFLFQVTTLITASKLGAFKFGMFAGTGILMLIGFGLVMLGVRIAKLHHVRFLLFGIVSIVLSAMFHNMSTDPMGSAPNIATAAAWSEEVVAIGLVILGIISIGFSFKRIEMVRLDSHQ